MGHDGWIGGGGGGGKPPGDGALSTHSQATKKKGPGLLREKNGMTVTTQLI